MHISLPILTITLFGTGLAIAAAPEQEAPTHFVTVTRTRPYYEQQPPQKTPDYYRIQDVDPIRQEAPRRPAPVIVDGPRVSVNVGYVPSEYGGGREGRYGRPERPDGYERPGSQNEGQREGTRYGQEREDVTYDGPEGYSRPERPSGWAGPSGWPSAPEGKSEGTRYDGPSGRSGSSGPSWPSVPWSERKGKGYGMEKEQTGYERQDVRNPYAGKQQEGTRYPYSKGQEQETRYPYAKPQKEETRYGGQKEQKKESKGTGYKGNGRQDRVYRETGTCPPGMIPYSDGTCRKHEWK